MTNQVEPGEPIYINGEIGEFGTAFVYFRLYSWDVGDLTGRTLTPGFKERKPYCVQQGDLKGVMLELANAGHVMSDIVMLEYRIVFCTLAAHGPQDGFSTSHAGESQSSSLDKYLSLDAVPPLGAVTKHVPFPSWNGPGLANIYFQARVSTLWEPNVSMTQWDFATDPAVTEWHLRIAP